MSNDLPRVPRGVPTGGEWRSRGFGMSDTDLTAEWADRYHELNEHGYVPAVAIPSISTPKSTAFRREWWQAGFATAEYGHSAGDYPQMPDDNTPAMTGGRSLAGNRRTHRMNYSGAGVELRMPSATAIRRFDRSIDTGTFDIPVSATYDGGESSVQGWVRVTRNGDDWHAEGLGFSDKADANVAEAVSAVLSARRVTMALTRIGDLTERRRARIEAEGTKIEPVDSSWIAGVGYEEDSQTMVMQTETGRYYGYRTDQETYEAVRDASSPGAAYNKLVKGQPRSEVVRCPRCARFTGSDGHTCPARQHERTGTTYRHNEYAESAGRSVLGAVATAHQAKNYGKHTIGGPSEDDLQLRDWLHQAGKQPILGGKTMFGRRGFTTDVAPDLRRHVSQQYVPKRPGYNNGDVGIAKFDGVDAKAATALKEKLPPAALDDSQNGAPTLGSMLDGVSKQPGRYEVGGYIVPPNRSDERVSADTLYVFPRVGETVSEDTVRHEVRDEFGGEAPDSVDVVDVPWRPGERAYRLWWD